MKPWIVLGLAAVAVAACGERSDTSAPSAPQAPVAPSPATQTSAPVDLAEDTLRRVCWATMATVHGQRPGVVEVDSVRDGVATLSWRAPVDGGRKRVDCRLEGDRVLWRLTDAPVEAARAWSDGPEHDVVRWALTDQGVVVTQTAPDGSVAAPPVTVEG